MTLTALCGSHHFTITKAKKIFFLICEKWFQKLFLVETNTQNWKLSRACLFISFYFYLFMYLSNNHSTNQQNKQTANLSYYVLIYLLIYLSIYQTIYLSIFSRSRHSSTRLLFPFIFLKSYYPFAFQYTPSASQTFFFFIIYFLSIYLSIRYLIYLPILHFV